MFHVVHIQYRGQHRGYEIWIDNRPLLTLKMGLGLKRNEAYGYCRSINA